MDILFSPEFLREGHSLEDNLHPSRIIVGTPTSKPWLKQNARKFADLLLECSQDEDTRLLFMGSSEAEAIKLFSNTYLALRVAYFNELDTYAMSKGLDTEDIINGVCLDPRIGSHYNNPSFGYGGYCLPNNTKQLLANYADVPQNLISAIVDTNETRKQFIVGEILKRVSELENPVVGVYRLTMKHGSDNFRESSVQDVMHFLKKQGIQLLIFEPSLKGASFLGIETTDELTKLLDCDLVIANRWHEDLAGISDKVFTRDLLKRD